MDNASVYGTEDCRFESCRGRVGHYTSTSCCDTVVATNLRSRRDILVFVGNDSELLAQPETLRDRKSLNKIEEYVAAWRNGQRVGLRNRRLQNMKSMWPRGTMDNASVYGTEDCRFESCRGRVGHYKSTSSAVIMLWRRISTLEDIFLFSLATVQDCDPEALCDPKIVKQRETVCGGVAQWTTRRSMEPKIAGSNPAVVVLDIIQVQAVL
uniref:Uncharacterized protein n=1 Tax=Parascaris univalens TaxID=6257 RepID=A0A915CJW9_PARUN